MRHMHVELGRKALDRATQRANARRVSVLGMLHGPWAEKHPGSLPSGTVLYGTVGTTSLVLTSVYNLQDSWLVRE